ncbi:MAG: hypothetical protein V1756_01510 [Patescibacteria group bacterium]
MPQIAVFTVIFVIINIGQIWLNFHCKSLLKGGLIIGLAELIELPLLIYILLKGCGACILVAFLTEAIHWTTIVFLSTRSKIKEGSPKQDPLITTKKAD